MGILINPKSSRRPPSGSRETRVIRWSRVVTLSCLAWAAVIYVMGRGFEVHVAGVTISSNDPWKALIAAGVATIVYLLAGGALPYGLFWASVRVTTRLAVRIGQIRPQHIAWALAVVTFGLYVTFGARAAGGADSYGYLSEADLWLQGTLKVDQSFALDVPWPRGQNTFTPFNHAPWSRDGRFLVPVCAPGFPLLLALAKFIGGQAAMFWVAPLGGAGLVLGTFYVIRRLASGAAGVIAAWLVATSPPVVFLSMVTFTDVPNAAVWTAAFVVLLSRRRWSELGAGLLCSLAVLIRPNLAPLVAFLALDIFLHFRGWQRPGLALGRVSLFCLGVLPGAAGLVAFNTYVFGTAIAHGSGTFSSTFLAWSRVGANFRNYTGALFATHTYVALAGVLALAVPLRRFWPGTADRRVFIPIGLFIVVLWSFYFAYDILPEWWYLRFMLPTWPFIIGGIGAVAAWLMPRGPLARLVVIAGVIVLGVVQLRTPHVRAAFVNGGDEARYVVAAQLARRVTVPNSVILGHQHSGSVRYYSGRMTMRFEQLDPAWLDRAVDWMAARGVHTYALLEDWEVPDVRNHFAGSARIAALETPVAVYRDPGTLFIYDLTSPPAPGAAPIVVTGIETGAGFGAVGPLPLERPVFK
jgi:hypothetical protein